jgi:hypothetical protein
MVIPKHWPLNSTAPRWETGLSGSNVKGNRCDGYDRAIYAQKPVWAVRSALVHGIAKQGLVMMGTNGSFREVPTRAGMTRVGAMPSLPGGSECPLLGTRDGPLYDGVEPGRTAQMV